MNNLELGKRYRIAVDPHMLDAGRTDDLFVALQYNFKPDSFKRSRLTDLSIDSHSESASISVPDGAEVKVLRGVVVSDIKESMLAFDGEHFTLRPVNVLVNSLKQVRSEKYVGGEAKRVNVSSFMKTLSKRKKKSTLEAAAASVTSATAQNDQNGVKSRAEEVPFGTESQPLVLDINSSGVDAVVPSADGI